MKKLFFFLLIVVVSTQFVLAGGSKEAEAQGDKVIEIEFYQQKREVVEIFDVLVERFNAANPGIHVTQTYVPEPDKVLSTRIASNDIPDVIGVWPSLPDFKLQVSEGIFEPLQNEKFASNALSSVVAQIQHADGSFYAIPISLNMYGVFYNKTKFEAMGLATPKTYAELIALAKKIQGAGEMPFAFPDKDSWTLRHQISMINGLSMSVQENKDIASHKIAYMDASATRETAEKLLELREYGNPDSLGMSYDQSINDYINQKTLMLTQGIWAIPTINAAEPDFEVSMFPFPANKESDTKVCTGIDLGIALTVASKNKEAAKKFIAYIVSTEGAQYYADMDKSPSAIIGVKTAVKEQEALLDLLSKDKSFEWTHNYYGEGGVPEVQRLGQMLIDTKDVDAFLKAMDEMFEETSKSLK